jgi:alginate O-acetyltransferase complex protein AlgI
MVFASPIFLFFFLPVVLALAMLARRKLVNSVLLASSLFFYAWGGLRHLPLLLAMVGFNWVAGLTLARQRRESQKRAMLAACVGVDLAILVGFKYTSFLRDNLHALGAPVTTAAAVVLPLGISFFTFHLISYVVDIYRGAAGPQRNPIDFALYICFFPQLIAGPIIRYHDVETQLTGRTVTVAKFSSGCERFIVGLAKKAILANQFAVPADGIFALNTADLSPQTAWFGLLCYALQLYFDFSGYSDMAIGLGRMFGFEYLENFNYPFISQSISEFWRRWHISLSNWFRDYLYTPLAMAAARRNAGKRDKDGKRRKFDDRPQLAFVFLVCGLWHGAAWNFVIWGAIHGIFLALERGGFGRRVAALPRFARHLYVVGVIMLAWVFFRSPTLGAALDFLAAMAGHDGTNAGNWPLAHFANTEILRLLPLGLIGLTPAFSWLTRDWKARAAQSFGQLIPAVAGEDLHNEGGDTLLRLARAPIQIGMLWVAASFVAGETYNPFIYFRF